MADALARIRSRLESARRLTASANRADLHHVLTIALRAIEQMADQPYAPLFQKCNGVSPFHFQGASPIFDAGIAPWHTFESCSYTTAVTNGAIPGQREGESVLEAVKRTIDQMRSYQGPTPRRPPGFVSTVYDLPERPFVEYPVRAMRLPQIPEHMMNAKPGTSDEQFRAAKVTERLFYEGLFGKPTTAADRLAARKAELYDDFDDGPVRYAPPRRLTAHSDPSKILDQVHELLSDAGPGPQQDQDRHAPDQVAGPAAADDPPPGGEGPGAEEGGTPAGHRVG
jgi:hypothetical protein